MIRVIALLLIVLALARLVMWGVGKFRSWRGNGKRLQEFAENGELSEATTDQVHLIEQVKARRKVAEGETEKTPHLTKEQLKEVMDARAAEREQFLDTMKLGPYQIILIFFIASILGLFLEEGWMWLTEHIYESRVGLVWGPFSPLYGVGACLFTIMMYFLRKRHAKLWMVFVFSVIVGGCLEQFTGWAMQTLIHASSWDYSQVPGAITQWVAVPFLIFWGILGCIWYAAIMPELLYRIGLPNTRRRVVVVTIIAIYLAADIFMTLACFAREEQRNEGIPPQNAFEVWLDSHYTDSWIDHRFQNLTIENQK